MRPKRYNLIMMFNVSVVTFSLFIVLMLALNPPITSENLFWRKPLVGIVFSLICVSGIFAAFFPKHCTGTYHFQKEGNNLASRSFSSTVEGHHLSCAKFSAHVIHARNHTLCAACTGLCLGAFMTLVGTDLYFFCGWCYEQTPISAVLIGMVGVVFGFLQLKSMGFARLMLNAFFVVGAFLILVGIDELTHNIFVDLFLLALIVFWILTRILLSQWDHWRICSNCKSSCEARKSRKNGVHYLRRNP